MLQENLSLFIKTFLEKVLWYMAPNCEAMVYIFLVLATRLTDLPADHFVHLDVQKAVTTSDIIVLFFE